MNSTDKRQFIALLFNVYDREVELFKIGILQYARPKKNWLFIHCAQDKIIEDLKRSDGLFAGGIGEFGRPDLWVAAKNAPFPVVNLYGGRGFSGMPTVGVSDRDIGKLGATHLLGQGFKNFAYFGLPCRGFSMGRWAGFSQELRKYNMNADCFKYFKSYPDPCVSPIIYVDTEGSFAGWLKALPKPCGIFCCDDVRAEWLALECQNLGIRVPDEVAILGVDNSDVHCMAAVPHLSSINLPIRQAGYAAAKMLDEIITWGSPKKDNCILFPPGSIVKRESTDILAGDNVQLVSALKFIRTKGHAGMISVDDVVAQTSYCRRILEQKFKEAFDTTIFQEIRRMQVDHAKRRLRDTIATMEDIAEACGWGNASHFGVEFKKITGMTPGEYRKKMHMTPS